VELPLVIFQLNLIPIL